MNTPGEAFDVFLGSGLDCLAIGNYLVVKPGCALPEEI